MYENKDKVQINMINDIQITLERRNIYISTVLLLRDTHSFREPKCQRSLF